MKNNSRRKSLRAVSFLLGVWLLMLSTVPMLMSAVAFAEEPAVPEPLSVGFTATDYYADTDNLVVFTVSLNRAADFDVTVSFHSENRSAIDTIDYSGVRSSVTVRRGETEAQIAVKTTGLTDYQTTNSNKIYSRYFALVLDSASEGAELRMDGVTAYGYLAGNFSMPIGVDSSIAYANVYHGYAVSAMRYDRVEAGVTLHTPLMLNKTNWGDYADAFGASAYARLIVQSQNENASFIKGGTDHWIAMGNSDWVRDKGDEDSSFGEGLILKFKTETCGNAEGVYMYADEFTKMIDGKNPHGGFNEPEMDIYTSSVSYVSHAYLYGNNVVGKTGSWVSVTRASDGSFGVGVSIYNKAKHDSTNYQYWTEMRLVDKKAPTVTNYMLDSSSLATSGVLRLIVRFSEPVYAGRTNTSLSVYLNGSSNPTEFDYAGGNYSDTLYFEWKAASKMYNSYRFEIQPKVDIIGDLAYNVNAGGKAENNHTGAFDSGIIMLGNPINYTKPEISFENKTAGYSRYHEVDVTTGTVEKGTLYYLWDRSPDDVRDVALYGQNKVDFIRPYTTLSNSGVNGSYYLHVMVVSELNQTSFATTTKPYHFDNTAPTLDALTAENLLQKKKVTFTFYDTCDGENVGGGGLDQLILHIADEDGVSEREFVLYDANKDIVDECLKLRNVDDVCTATFWSSLVGLDAEGNEAATEADVRIDVDHRIIGLMNGEPRKVYRVYFELTDNCGNVTSTRPEKWIYDNRSGFKTEDSVGGLTPYDGIADAKLYDIGTEKTTSLTVTTAQENGTLRLVIKEQYAGFLDGILFGGEQILSNVVEGTSPDKSTITLTGLHPGCYEIEPYFLPDGATEAEILVAPVIEFYVTSALSEKTANAVNAEDGDLVLRNEVYRLTTPFYYLEAVGETPKSHPYGAVYDSYTGKYVGGSTSPSFSSLAEMRDYVTYMEYSDMYLVSITAGNASSLNSGTGSTVYVKADGETQTAVAGQLWIRYKRANWTPGGNSYSWAFYYYGTGSVADGIDLRGLSANLRDAIYKVRDTICDTAVTDYLVGDGGRSSATGAPSLKPSQIHAAREECAVTHAGTVLAVPVSYDGDEGIYENTVQTEDGVFPLATNVPLLFSSATKLYFKYGDTNAAARYQPLDVLEGDTYRTAVGGETGVYTLLELDANGASVYEVYLDVNAPTLTVSLNGEERVVEPDTTVFSGTTFSFVSLTGEVDSYAYVGVYSYTTGDLLAVYYADRGETVSGKALSEANFWVEVGDRSGNSFTFLLRLATGDLTVTTAVTSSGSGVRVTVENRLESEIYRYEVTCNNLLVTNEYAQTRLFTEAGIYSVLVQDIYGNTYRSGTVTFKRKSPELTWSYQNAYGTYSTYNPNSVVAMLITDDETVGNRHYVSTSTLVRFRMPDDGGGCSFSLEGLPDGGYKVDTTGLAVSIQELSGWTLKVWYTDYPDNYETYVCVVDHSAPEISVSYIGTPYIYNEGTSLVSGTDLIPDTLKYSVTSPTVFYAVNGDVFHGTSVNVSAADEFGIKSVTVTLNGKPVSETADENGVLHLTGYGEYKVIATDLFGNTGTFTFRNTQDPVTLFTVDGQTPVTGSLSEALYGHESLLHSLAVGGEAEWLVHLPDGSRRYYHFRAEEDALRLGHYEKNAEGEGGEEPETVWDDFPIYSADIFRNEWQTFLTEETYAFAARVTEDGTVEIRLTVLSGTVNVETRVGHGQGMLPSYGDVKLSTEGSDVTLLSQNAPVLTNRQGELIFVNHPFKVAEVTDELVLRVRIAYSETLAFGAYTVLWESGDGAPAVFNYSAHGYYRVQIENRYGNVTVYTVLYSDAAGVVAVAKYADGMENTYTAGYEGVIRSNGSVTVTVYSLNAKIFLDGVEVEPEEKDGILSYVVTEKGDHEVAVLDAGGTETCFPISLKNILGYIYSEEWITGYNEKALLKDRGYTNKRLTVTADPERVSRITVQKDGGEEIVVYDTLSEHTVTDPALLAECVGKEGDGVYRIVFRSSYGAVSAKTVYYRETPTLILTRITAVSGGEEGYPIELAVSDGFYSNNTLTFATEANVYRFTVGGEAYSLEKPKSYEFRSATGNGSFRYAIAYVDEYGFEYEFEAVLYRQTVEIGTDGMKLVDRGGVPVTRGDLFVTFPKDCAATVLLDGGTDEAIPYVSGTPIRRDGTYRFTVVDKAGNIAHATVIRDSTVFFAFTDTFGEVPIENGGVVNDAAILFSAQNDDNVTVEKAIYNGKEYDGNPGVRFSKTGKWEFLLSDDVGNRAYFSCYLINHELSKFTYEAPYGYTVTEVWLTDAEGNRTLTAEKGSAIRLTEDGDYAVILTSDYDNRTMNFTVTLDNTPPDIRLSGVTNGGETAKPVTLEGFSIGDEVYIWRNGDLVYHATVETVSDVPTVEEGGSYRVVVRNRAGVEEELTFSKKYIANTAASVFIVVGCLSVATVIFIGLLYRNRSKTDK